ncbi:fatty acid desaturase [Robertmurraya andreesenii]|uniref:Omega-6 fatty acid desaturase (Delta-12 desaturase) n=1 Tax=Anoxybacillus andreesenii TaxID=1325932 RepID=A0ABT9V0U4_9BACL|nr:fatty acid desaturase [Robertmurraya andreesenii]MDQ0154573.1 omega-6 fatty acid desaturase (delta-12 desaturase) [Robertmurraya andreesenii]
MSKEKEKNLRKQMAPYEKATMRKSIYQMVNTFVPFFLLWILAYQSLKISYALTFILCVVAAGFLVRIFIIFHDCCHYSFFRNRRANDILGTITGVLTLFPYRQWQHDHSVHHATSSNLDKRGTGDIWMLTVDEYLEASTLTKIQYRLYRHPFVMFVLGPIYKFLIQNRFNRKGARKKERVNTYLTNSILVLLIVVLSMLLEWKSFFIIQGTIFMISGAAGIWLFYVQHTFEDSYFEEDEHWEYVRAAVEGSSFYKLPRLLQWLTGNIGYHHVHHLSPRIPNYKLEEAHENTPPLQNVPTVTLSTSLESLKFHLWDEEQKVFIGFRELKKRALSKVQKDEKRTSHARS